MANFVSPYKRVGNPDRCQVMGFWYRSSYIWQKGPPHVVIEMTKSNGHVGYIEFLDEEWQKIQEQTNDK